jgi:hypothetical protein
MTACEASDPFELSLYGGAIERRYRRASPEVEALPWGTMDLDRFGVDQIEAARSGWTQAARQELESAAVHARVLEQMVRARMPLDLIALSTQFQREELVHAEIASRLAMELGGGVVMKDEPMRLQVIDRSPEAELAETALWAMCVSETFSHAMLSEGLHRAKAPLFSAARMVIAKDEAAHARLGWLLLEGLAPDLTDADRSRLRRVAKASIGEVSRDAEAVLKLPRAFFSEIAAVGDMDPQSYRDSAKAAIEERVMERLRGLDLLD